MAPKCLLTVAALLTSAIVCAQSPLSDTSYRLLDQAVAKTDLDASDAPPYRLHAHLTISDDHGKAIEGELLFLFSSPSRWREEITYLGVTSVQMVALERIWRRDVDERRVALMRLDRLRHFSQQLLPLRDGKVSPPQSKNLDGIQSECIKSTAGASVRQICLDSANGLPVHVHDGSEQIDFDWDERFSLGTKRFPRRIHARLSNTILEMDTDSLMPLGDLSVDAFTPPPDATSMPWCLQERPPSPVFTGHSPLPFPFPSGLITVAIPPSVLKFLLVIFDVATDGHVKNVKAYSKDGLLLSGNADAEELRRSVFEPAACRGKAVEGEFIVDRTR